MVWAASVTNWWTSNEWLRNVKWHIRPTVRTLASPYKSYAPNQYQFPQKTLSNFRYYPRDPFTSSRNCTEIVTIIFNLRNFFHANLMKFSHKYSSFSARHRLCIVTVQLLAGFGLTAVRTVLLQRWRCDGCLCQHLCTDRQQQQNLSTAAWRLQLA